MENQIVIKVILLAGLVGVSVLWLKALGNRLAGRLFFIVQLLIGAVLVCRPEFAQKCADLVGVGRGTDLLLYMLVLLVYAGGFVILAKFRILERKMTEIARKLAILDGEKKGTE